MTKANITFLQVFIMFSKLLLDKYILHITNNLCRHASDYNLNDTSNNTHKKPSHNNTLTELRLL